MKTTIELPDALVKQVKLRALRRGQKLKDTVAELLREGLAASTTKEPLARLKIVKHKKSGLPIIECPRQPTPEEELTPQRVADVLLEQEVEWARGAGR